MTVWRTGCVLAVVCSLAAGGCRPAAPGIIPADESEGRALAEARRSLADGGDVNELLADDEGSVLFNEGGFTRLHMAAARGQRAVVAFLLARGADPQARSEIDGLPALYYALAGGHTAAAEQLLACYSPPKSKALRNDSPLHLAVRRGQDQLIVRLLARGARVNEQDRLGLTPLDEAVRAGRDRLVSVLLKAGGRPGALAGRDNSYWALADWAVSHDNRIATHALLPFVEDVDRRDEDKNDPPLLNRVVRRQWVESVQLLIRRGADLNIASGTCPALGEAVSQHSLALAQMLLDAGCDPDVRDWAGQTALHNAARHAPKSFARLLIDRGAAVNIRDKDQRTPLLLAIPRGDLDVAELLIEANADVNVADKDGETPLLRAIKADHFELAEKLVRRGADVNRVSREGHPPLGLAIWRNRWSLARLIVSKGADLEAANQFGYSALQGALWGRQVDFASELIRKGADVRRADKLGRTPLHLAAEWCGKEGDGRIVAELVAKGADVNARNHDGRSPLHVVGGIVMAAALVGAGANVNARDKSGRTPLDRVNDRAKWDLTPQQHAQDEALRKYLVAQGGRASGKPLPPPLLSPRAEGGSPSPHLRPVPLHRPPLSHRLHPRRFAVDTSHLRAHARGCGDIGWPH